MWRDSQLGSHVGKRLVENVPPGVLRVGSNVGSDGELSLTDALIPADEILGGVVYDGPGDTSVLLEGGHKGGEVDDRGASDADEDASLLHALDALGIEHALGAVVEVAAQHDNVRPLQEHVEVLLELRRDSVLLRP